MAQNRNFVRITCAAPGQWLYLFGDEGVVYSETQNRFAGLDAAGTAAFRAFDAGSTIGELRSLEMRDDVRHPAHTLETIHALVQGIFPGEDALVEPPQLGFDLHSEPLSANIEIGGVPIRLKIPDGPLDQFCRDYFLNCPASNRPAIAILSAQRGNGEWSIHVNGRRFFTLGHEQQIGLGFMHAARSLLYAKARFDVAFHAAMVANADCGVLLSAPRERGKSTLAAFLIARGFDLLADEPALLRLDTASVLDLPLPISLKEGSWPLFAADLRQIEGSPVHIRSDGTKIRLVHPPRYSATPRRITHVVFPHYCPSLSPQIEPVSPFLALRLLSEGGMRLAPHLSRNSFECFLNLICETASYRLCYASLREASQMLRTVGCAIEE